MSQRGRAHAPSRRRPVARPCSRSRLGQQLQLFELVGASIERSVDVGQFFARGNERRRQRHGPLEGLQRLGALSLLAQAEAEQVVRVGQPSSSRTAWSRAIARRRDPVAVAGEGQLVGDPRRAIVETQCAHRRRRSRGRTAEAGTSTSPSSSSGRGDDRIEGRGRAEVARRRVEVAAPPVGFAAPQVGEHRVGTKRDGAAIGLDRAERLVAR